MTTSNLPRQIVFLAVAAFVAVQALLWVSLFALREKMDQDASELSQRHIEGRVNSLQKQVSLIASDYHNWTDIFLDARSLDIDKLSSNYGITAHRGEVFQYAELYDGPFVKPISWRANRGLMPQDGFIDENTRSALRALVRDLDVVERQTVNYFEWRDDHLIMFSSSNLLPENEDLMLGLDLEAWVIAVIGRTLSSEQLAKIEDEFSVSALEVVVEPRNLEEKISLAATGVRGKPVAWIEWFPPTPGTVLFYKMVPILVLSSLILATVFYSAVQLLRDGASKLIAQEAASFDRARTDSLTCMPNRFALCEYLEKIDASGFLNYAIIALDLNDFKLVNDSMGHIGGDSVLRTFAERLESLVDDDTFVARMGGDEFVVVVSSLDSVAQKVSMKCSKMDAFSREPIEYNGVQLDIAASKGVAMLQNGEFCANELLRRADRALYAAKACSDLKAIYYDADMELEDQEHQLIERELRKALVHGTGLSIAYQPIVAAGNTYETIHYEALARWTCSDLGQIPPGKFIHVAESTGLIVRLGWLLLEMICRDIREFNICKVSVNISPVQLMVPAFAQEFAERILLNGIRPEQIEVEVTEQIAIRNEAKIFHELWTFRELGFSVALDDFGTGFASIGFLTRMPFSVLKIDRSFVKQGKINSQVQKMLISMIGLARSMDLLIIAEGIETFEEASCFLAFGADYLQGFHFGRPMNIRDLMGQVKLSENYSDLVAM